MIEMSERARRHRRGRKRRVVRLRRLLELWNSLVFARCSALAPDPVERRHRNGVGVVVVDRELAQLVARRSARLAARAAAAVVVERRKVSMMVVVSHRSTRPR